MSTEDLSNLCAPGAIINDVIAAAFAGGVSVITGSQAYAYHTQSAIVIPPGCQLVGENSTGLKLKRVDNDIGGSNFGFMLSDNSYIGNLLIDGNGANQTVNSYAVLGYKIQAPMLERLFVINNRGIGVGMSNVAKADHRRVSVSGSVGSSPGFWCGSDSTASYYAQGGHTYRDCDSLNNQLDGIIVGVPCLIDGGEWSNNGYGGAYGGALGAAGIFTNETGATPDVTIMNTRCVNNAEWGINSNTKDGKILNNRCELNALSGIYVGKYSSDVILSGNSCISNGTYTGTGYQTLGIHGGISIANGAQNIQVTSSNRCYNDPAKGSTQKYGIEYAASAWPNLTSANFRIAGNQTFGNLVANDNLRPGAFANGNLTNLDYGDAPTHSDLIGASAASVPAGDGIDIMQIVGAPVITNISGGYDGKRITLVGVSAGQHPVIAQGSFQMANNANFTFNGNYFSSITFEFLNGAWRELGRSQL